MVDIQAGELIGRFRVIARESKADVFHAVDVLCPRAIRLKVGTPGDVSKLADRCFAEELEHPGMARIEGCGLLEDGRRWTATVLPKGVGLDEILARRQLFVGEVLTLLADAASVIAHAHAFRIVHGTLCTSNITLPIGAQEHPVMISGWADLDVDRRAAASVFSAPEVDAGAKPDERADVFALGVIAYRALTGGFPPPEVSEVPGVPPDLSSLIAKMLASDPALRLKMTVVRARAAHQLEVMARNLAGNGRRARARVFASRHLKISLSQPLRYAPPTWTASDELLSSGRIISGEIELGTSRAIESSAARAA